VFKKKSPREEYTMSEKSLAGRKALVTGGARGIGAAIAEALAHAGASVMIGDILVDLGKETAGRLAKTGAKTGFVDLNVTDDAQWEKAVAATIAALGGYDILINNAGIEITSLVIDLKAEDLRRMRDVNIVGTGLGMKHAFRAMRPGGSARNWRSSAMKVRAAPSSTSPRSPLPSRTRPLPGTPAPSRLLTA
jgi:3alpha(or 20beta)-hydroxysteroid dehydrogenase